MNESAPTSPPWHCVLCCCGYSLSYSLPRLALQATCCTAVPIRKGRQYTANLRVTVETLGWPGTHTPTDRPTDRPTWHFSLLPHPTTTPPLTIACTEASKALQPSSSERRQGHRCVLYAMRCWRGRPERVLQCDAVRDVCRTIVWECPHEMNEACAWPMAATRSGFGRNARSPWPAEYSPSTHHGLQSTPQVLVDSDKKSHDRFDCRPDRRQSTAV